MKPQQDDAGPRDSGGHVCPALRVTYCAVL